MKFRTIFWTVLFSLPIVAAVALSIPLQRERAVWMSQIGRLEASILERGGSIKQLGEQTKVNAAKQSVLETDIAQTARKLSPWHREMLAAQSAGVRLAADAAQKGRAGLKSGNQMPPVVEYRSRRPYFGELLGDPIYAKAVAVIQKQQAEASFGRLVAGLNLNPADQDRFENLLADWNMTGVDVTALLAGTGIASGPATGATYKDIDQEILDGFGSQVEQQFRAALNTRQYYQAMDDLATRLSYTATPLSPSQEDQLVALLVQNYGVKPRSRWLLNDALIGQAQGFLAQPQVDALRQFQAERAAVAQGRAGQ